jgi:AraC-like DNA-binding protein
MTPTARNLEPPPSLDEVLYSSPVLRIGKFRVGPDDPRFHDSGPAENHIFVFPRTLVRIRHEGQEAFVAGPDVVTYYNRGQVYRRDSVGGRPDRCEWFAFDEGVLRDALSARDPGAADRPDRPFAFSHGPAEPVAYFLQRRVVESLSRGEAGGVDSLEVEETLLDVLDRILRARELAPKPEPGLRRSHSHKRDLSEEARVELARAGDRRSLTEIAAALGVSIFHLCRVFRRETGTTLHAYRNRLRLAMALELVPRRRRELTDVALALGYSSHSHFTAAFRREYGVTPTSLFEPRWRSRTPGPSGSPSRRSTRT